MFSEVMRYILDLGPTVMLPIVIIIFSKILGMKAGDCFKAGLHIGIGFVGIGLVIGLMLGFHWSGGESDGGKFRPESACGRCRLAGLFTHDWASQIALVAIPIAILVNVAMLLTRMTRVVNVDIWNIWHMTFTGALPASGNRFMDDRDGGVWYSRGVCFINSATGLPAIPEISLSWKALLFRTVRRRIWGR
ncbi:PTS system, galactitol-specific IIC component protein [Escherichia coli]|nr:PTS system, galactitol-specific IIC component protein [Escherichia coli]